MASLLEGLRGQGVAADEAALLFEAPDRRVYWVGADDGDELRCNAYLACGPDANVLIDPGGRSHFADVRRRVGAAIDPSSLTHLLVHHQDPDLCGSLPEWLAAYPSLRVVTSWRTSFFLRHYFAPGAPVPTAALVDRDAELEAGLGLTFPAAPFLHFPGAFVSYDPRSRFLFSGDILGASHADGWTLVIDDFDAHLRALEPFHRNYMASNRALRGFLANLEGLEIDAVLPQHGAILEGEDAGRALAWLRDLRCGTDLLYPDPA